MLMRGGTSKGAYFLATDLPDDPAARDDLLLRIMGSPDERQIDGLGGAHPLTSKVAVISPSADPAADIDYLFLQVAVGRPEVSDHQNCGNILAGVGPFAVERALVAWLTFTDKSYDVVYTSDRTGATGRLHHIAFAADTREDILRAADLAIDTGVFIETGPHKHAIQQTFFLYVYEPGGNRVELCNPLTRLVLAPDWPLITWTEAERAKGQAWGLRTIESFHTHGTPPVA
ncbi:PrpF domain-containing protein [Streptomyces sp. NPDC093568]|uniref:PrpF domain-containing protein n=1 Tax=Streptomyces sp. NPDC093568 TaxID=3366041 RepID=UPI00381F98A8